MKRRVNSKLVMLLAGGFFVTSVILAGAHYVQSSRTSDLFLAEARKAVELDDTENAVRSYRSHLRLSPDSIEGRSEFGRLLMKAGNYGSASDEFEHVLRLDQKDTQARRDACECLVRSGRFSDALAHLERFDDQSDAELLDWQGQCRQSLREFDAAADCYSQSMKISPDRLETSMRLAILLDRQLSRSDEAESVMEQMTQMNPTDAQASLFRAQFYLAKSEQLRSRGETLPAEAEAARASEHARRSIELDREDVQAHLLLARCYQQSADDERAIEVADQAQRLAPHSSEPYLLLSQAHRRNGQPDRAIAALQSGVETLSARHDAASGQLQLALCELYLDLVRPDEAGSALADAKALAADPVMLKYLDGRLLLINRNLDVALETLESVRLDFVDRPATAKWVDHWIGEACRLNGRYQDAIDAFRQSISRDASLVLPRVSLVNALESSGQFDEAYEELRQLVRLDHAPLECQLMLAQRSVRRNLLKLPEARDWTETLRMIDRIDQLRPELPESTILRAQVAAARGDSDQASELLDRSTADSESISAQEKLTLYLARSDLAQQQGSWDEAAQSLDAAIAEFPNDVTIRISKAAYLVRRSGKESLDDLRLLIDESPQWNAVDKIKFYTGIGTLAVPAGLYALSSECFDIVSEQHPDNIDVWKLGVNLAAATQQPAMLKRSLQQLHRLGCQDADWHFGTAQHLRLDPTGDHIANLNESLKHTAIAKTLRPSWRQPLLLETELYAELNQRDSAIESVTRAIELGERSPAVLRTATGLLFANRDFAGADKILRMLNTGQIVGAEGFGRAASFISIEMNDHDRGLDVARKTASVSTQLEDHLWHGQLAWMLAERAGERKDLETASEFRGEAESAMRRAIEIAPENSLPWIQWVRFLVDSNRREEARAETLRMVQSVNADSRTLAKAQCFEALGDVDEAISAYEQAVSESPDNHVILQTAIAFLLQQRRSERAEILLQNLVSLPDSPDEFRRWGRRQIAVLRINEGGGQNLAAANQLIQTNLQSSPESMADARVKATLLANDSSPGSLGQAIQVWKSITGRREGVTPDDHYHLALTLKASGNWTAAGESMRRAIAGSANLANESTYITRYIDWLLERGELPDAQTWYKRLEAIAANDTDTKRISVELLARSKKHSEAVAILQQMIDENADDQKSNVETLVNVAQLARRLESVVDPAERQPYVNLIIDCLRHASDLDSKFRFPLAQTFVRIDKPAEAIESLCRSPIGSQELDAAIPTLDTLVLTGGLTDQQLQWVETELDRMTEQFGESSGVLGVRASVKKSIGDRNDANRIYRQIINREPNNIVALNNLAVSLSEDDSKLAEAAALSDRTIEIAGRVPALIDTRAVIAIAAGDAQTGLALLTEATTGDAANVSIFLFHRAVANLRSGNSRQAAEDLSNAVAIGLDRQALGQRERSWIEELESSAKPAQTQIL